MIKLRMTSRFSIDAVSAFFGMENPSLDTL